MTVTRRTRLAAIVLAGLLVPRIASAQAVSITSAVADVANQLLMISGYNFCSAPVVTIGGYPTTLQNPAAPNLITTSLPGAVAANPATYYLVVSCGSLAGRTAYFNPTVGAVGPKGDKGEPGQDGHDGAQGAQGVQGPPGPAGSGIAGATQVAATIYEAPTGNVCGLPIGQLTTKPTCSYQPFCQTAFEFTPPANCAQGEPSSLLSVNYQQTNTCLSPYTYPYACNPYQCNFRQCNCFQHSYSCHPHSCGFLGSDTCYDTCFEQICDTCWDTCYQTCTGSGCNQYGYNRTSCYSCEASLPSIGKLVK